MSETKTTASTAGGQERSSDGGSMAPLAVRGGNILDAKETYIAHQCNCITNHAAGLAKDLFAKFPWADIYKIRGKDGNLMRDKPGKIIIKGDGKEQRFVINMLAQNYPGHPKPYETEEMRRSWFKSCLDELSLHLAKPKGETKDNAGGYGADTAPSVAFPEGIGCTMAGGTWKNYLLLIENFARENPHIKVALIRR